jgi:hypothetical protein
MLFGFGNLFVTQPHTSSSEKKGKNPRQRELRLYMPWPKARIEYPIAIRDSNAVPYLKKKTREKSAYEESGHKIVECLLSKMLNAKC